MAPVVNWQSSENSLFLNPRLNVDLKSFYQKAFEQVCLQQNLQGHLGFLTSGTTTTDPKKQKIVLLSKSAFLNSATAVTQGLGVTEGSIWMRSLPRFHVGGLAIEARAFVRNFTVIEMQEAWNPQKFVDQVKAVHGTWASLVPTQVFDLVQAKLRSPESLQVLVGGGRLSPALQNEAQLLGWNLIPSYGMTEAASTLALIQNDVLKPFSHTQFFVKNGFLALQSSSLFTGYARNREGSFEFFPPHLHDGIFITEDRAIETSKGIQFLGRDRDVVKISGELVSLPKLRDQWATLSKLNSHIMALPDARTENKVVLVLDEESENLMKDHLSIRNQLAQFHSHVMPFERVQSIMIVKQIPKTELGKVQEAKLLQMIEEGKSYELRLN